MEIDTFLLERNQTLYENDVELNLTESGIHPFTIRDLLSDEEIDKLLSIPIGYGYTDGTPLLRERIAAWYSGATKHNVAITHGASEANLIGLLSALSPGDELVFLLPNFLQLSGLARAFGIDLRPFPLSDANGWQPDLEQLQATVTARTRMVALVNPNNPTGIVHTPEVMRGVVEIAERHGAYLLADEIYRGAEIDRDETPSYFGMYERTIVTSSLSKAFANPGLRLGWIVAQPEFIREAMRRQDYTSIGTSRISQALAETIMEPRNRGRILRRTRDILHRNAKLVADWVGRESHHVTWIRPQAGGMAFLRYALPISSEEFSRRLREEESVFVVAGSWFGIEGCIRIGLGIPPEELEEALERLGRFLDRNRRAEMAVG